MKLTLDACKTLAEIDLGESDRGYFDDKDLGVTGGNLYLYLDGVEYGSLFFFRREDGTVTITLGQLDLQTQEWEERNPLVRPVDDTTKEG